MKQQLYTPKTKFQGIMFSKSFYHFLFSWQTPIKNYPHNCTYGGVYFTTIFLKAPIQLKKQSRPYPKQRTLKRILGLI
ncbi:hypothetical protein [Helicobacter pylori]|uniref:hypothetical protein n=1 Tax=Helicobacter pylori TaxID=210 RepID=UPI003F8E05F3